MTLPEMPTAVLLQCVCDDGSADYMDGDDPGYAWFTWDGATLTLIYEPDESPDLDPQFAPRYGKTKRFFREIVAPEPVS